MSIRQCVACVWVLSLALVTSFPIRAQDSLPQTSREPLTDIRLRPLTPDLVPPFPRRPPHWGRLPEHHLRFGRSSNGLPLENYDRTIPRVVARAVSFRTTGPERIDVSRLVHRFAESHSTPFARSKTEFQGSNRLTEVTSEIRSEPSEVRFKRFELAQRQLVAAPFVLNRVGVMVFDDGHVLGTGELIHTGGVKQSERGGQVLVSVRGLAAGPDRNADPLAPGVITLWSISESLWVPRGGPTPLVIRLDFSNDPHLITQVATGFELTTHIEVTLERKDIR